MFLKHESGESVELRNQQILGEDSPLEFDEDGLAEVDDDRGQKLLAMHRHIERARAPTAKESDDDGDFDAEAFVDRTPMGDVVNDIESGEYDDHLDAIEDAADREGVLDAVDDRRE